MEYDLGSDALRIVNILAEMDENEMIANILHDHNYSTDQQTECLRKWIDVQEILKHIMHDHNYSGDIFNTEAITDTELNWRYTEVSDITDDHEICKRIEAKEIGVVEKILYPEEKFQGDGYMLQGNIQNILGSSALDRKMRFNYGTSEANQLIIHRADGIGVSSPALQMNFKQISSNDLLNHTMINNNSIVQTNKKIMDCPYKMDKLTDLTSIETRSNVEDRSMLFADKTILSSDTSFVKFEQHPIKQEKDCDVYDPGATQESLDILNDLTSAANIKIEDFVSEWNNENIDSSYSADNIVSCGIKPDTCNIHKDSAIVIERFNCDRCRYCIEKFETSEMKVKHEFICRLAPHLVVNIVKLNIFPKEEIKEANDFEVAYMNLAICKYCNEGFKTSELKLKHECVCKYARRLVIQLQREVEDILPKKRRKSTLRRELASCWSGIDEVWKPKKEKVTESERESARVQKKEDIYERSTFETKYKTYLERHTLVQNKDGRSVFSCHHCGYKFNHKSSLSHHLLRYREKKKEFGCHKCSFTAYSRTTLRMHKKNKHTLSNQLKNCQCAHCPSVYFDKTNLGEHILRRHPEFSDLVTSKVHQCKNCLFKTTYKSHLRDHMSTHSKVYPHKCKICGYKTNRKSHLTRHMESHVGMGIGSYQKHASRSKDVSSSKVKKFCSICNKSFKIKLYFDSHIVIHHSENKKMMKIVTNKIHTCKYCDYKRICLKVIKRHEKVRHEK